MPKEVLPWLIFPPTPKLRLDQALKQGIVKNSRGIRFWHAIFGVPLETSIRRGKTPVLLLHGGVTSSEWSAPQVEFLQKDHTVIVLDLPGHGKTPFDDRELSYKKLADDIAGFLDAIGVSKVALVTWSEGTMMAWSLLAYGHHRRIERAFMYSGLDDYRNADAERVMGIPMVGQFFSRAEQEWKASHPGQSWDDFLGAWMGMWLREPTWSTETYKHVPPRGSGNKDAPIIWVVTGDHDDWIPPEVHPRMAGFIPNSSFLIMPSAGHLAFIQNTDLYNRLVQTFLEDTDLSLGIKASL